MGRFLQEEPRRQNHELAADKLREAISGLKTLIRANQKPDEWSRIALMTSFMSVSANVRRCQHGHQVPSFVQGHDAMFDTHKVGADFCEKMARAFEQGNFSVITESMVHECERHLADIEGCTSPLRMY